jgi:hypothetical protein
MSNPTKLGQKLPWNYAIYLLGLFIFGLSCSSELVSRYYSPYFFDPMSNVLRMVFGWFQNAIGEWVYLFILISLIINYIRGLLRYSPQFKVIYFWKLYLVKGFNTLVKIYILFMLLWGFNYQRLGPEKHFKIQLPTHYTEAQMDSLSLDLIGTMNSTRLKISNSDINNLKFDRLASLSKQEYAQIQGVYPFLNYHYPSIKKAAFPIWGDYFGYTAFYQPITGEAIIRGDLPILTMPFTICHEMAHQLGYASESEANFIAYVIGVESKNPIFNYATQLQLFTYAQQAHLKAIAQRGDQKMFMNIIERNKKLMSPKVLADRKIIRNFFTIKQALQFPGSAQAYDQFLQWNHQKNGIQSYNDVLLWALAYKRIKIYSSTSYSQ